jgi:N-acetylglucosamine-6-sulfatase
VRVLLAAAAALLFCGQALAKPNVVVVLTDDQRADTLAYMPTVQTELSAKGVTFGKAFAVNPLCCPSRASLLTGTYSHTNGVWANDGAYGGFHVFDDRSTLAVWLDEAGYETMLIGKYLNGYSQSWTDATDVPPGWDRWLAYWGGPAYYGYNVTDGETVREYGLAEGDYATDVMGAEAVRFIREAAGPFFLLFAPKAPHTSGSSYSVDPAPRHAQAFDSLEPWRAPNVNERNVADKPRYIRRRAPLDEAKLATLREEQLESLLAVDEAVASMLAALEERGELANTVVIFMSDNGMAWGAHRWRQKIVPYEESLRIPLVVRYDGVAVPRTVRRRFALNIDLAPTIAAIAGIAAPTEGRSLLPLVANIPTSWRQRFLIERGGTPSEVPAYCGFRGQRWKYVQYATGEEELYDLPRDRFELRNVSPERPRVVDKQRARVLRSDCRPPGFVPLRPRR